MQTIYESRPIEITDLATRIFAEVCGDRNGIHLDEEIASKSRFGRRIAHGTLIGAFISAALAECYPRAVYLEQELSWLKPVRIGDEARVLLTKGPITASRKALINTKVRNQDNEVVLDGIALLLLPPPSEMGLGAPRVADVGKLLVGEDG